MQRAEQKCEQTSSLTRKRTWGLFNRALILSWYAHQTNGTRPVCVRKERGAIVTVFVEKYNPAFEKEFKGFSSE